MIDTKLRAKNVLITGANNAFGIGAGIARAFASEDANIFLHYFRSTGSGGTAVADATSIATAPGSEFYSQQQKNDASAVLDSFREKGSKSASWHADLSDPSKIYAMLDEAEQKLGHIDVVINNACYWEADTFLPPNTDMRNKLVELWSEKPTTITAGSFDRQFAVTTRAVALIMAEFARRHIARGAVFGRIINISTDGAHCFPSEVSYGASKLAMEGYTRSAAAELGRFGITVNAISPGPIQTGWITPELEREIVPKIPMGRVGTPQDIADAVVFLASEQARWITGQVISVGGGNKM